MKKYKIGFTEGLNNLCTFIQTSPRPITYQELMQFSIDYDCFIDFYMNLNILDRLMLERNKKLLNEKKSDSKN